MFAIRNGLRNLSRLSGVPTRSYTSTIVSAPPEVRMSRAEVVICFFCFASAYMFWPMYFVPRFKKWGAPKGE